VQEQLLRVEGLVIIATISRRPRPGRIPLRLGQIFAARYCKQDAGSFLQALGRLSVLPVGRMPRTLRAH